MAWYDRFTLSNTDKNTLDEIATFVKKEAPVVETNPEEEWIWVEGYKGVDENMQGYGGFQYELGKEYSVDGEIEECKNGLHFSLKLEDAFGYKQCMSHRFFKVRAYVRKKDVDNYGVEKPIDATYTMRYKIIQDKLAAQKIILTEEITETEIVLNAIKDIYPKVKTYDDAKQVRLLGYEVFVTNKYREVLSKYFSELFVELFIDKFSMTTTKCYFYGSRLHDMEVFSDTELEAKTKEIIAYIEEGVSKDVAIYLLMK